jgi:hypothetical protein
VSSDTCFNGMPSSVGPVAILGLWSAMLGAAIVRPLEASKCGNIVFTAPNQSGKRLGALVSLDRKPTRREVAVVWFAKEAGFSTSLGQKVGGANARSRASRAAGVRELQRHSSGYDAKHNRILDDGHLLDSRVLENVCQPRLVKVSLKGEQIGRDTFVDLEARLSLCATKLPRSSAARPCKAQCHPFFRLNTAPR